MRVALSKLLREDWLKSDVRMQSARTIERADCRVMKLNWLEVIKLLLLIVKFDSPATP